MNKGREFVDKNVYNITIRDDMYQARHYTGERTTHSKGTVVQQ